MCVKYVVTLSWGQRFLYSRCPSRIKSVVSLGSDHGFRSREAIMDITRRALLAGGLALAAGLVTRGGAAAAKPTITVYKSPT